MRSKIALLAGVAGAALQMFAAGAATAETLKVAVGQRGFWNSSYIEFALQQGFFKQEGLEIDILYTDGGATTLAPVISGSIDIATTNGTLGVIAAYAKGMPVKIISAETTGAADAFWYARSGSGIKTIKDTNGRTVAFSSPGSSTNLIILQLINQEKATPKLTATGGLPATLTQVMSGQIDVGWAVPPFVLKEVSEGRLNIVARGNDAAAIRDQTIRVNVANTNSLKTKREAITKFVRVMGRAIDWAYDGDAAIEAYALLAKVPRELAKRTRDEFYPKQASQLGEIRGLDLTLKQALEYKYISSPLAAAAVEKGLFDILYVPPK